MVVTVMLQHSHDLDRLQKKHHPPSPTNSPSQEQVTPGD